MASLRTLFNLRQGEDDKAKVLKNVKSNISFTGPTLWILMCAIVIASVGLNVNSTAVIIGAMLISPLMGPIVGAGFALGMFDFVLLRKSLSNLLTATLASLLVSGLYFWLTPFKEAQSEILSRTSPNFYDILIAFFGGLAGAITITRTDKGTPIAGVAIATALMPPLCTAGYGLANGDWKFFGGALFLYAINCTFICLATLTIVKLLNYPAFPQADRNKAMYVRLITTLLVLFLTLPSIWFAYTFLEEQNYKKRVSHFLKEAFEEKGNTLIYQRTNTKSHPNTIELAFLLRRFTRPEIDSLNRKLPEYGLRNTRLIIRQDSSFLTSRSKKDEAENEVNPAAENAAILELQKELALYKPGPENLLSEVQALYPTIQSFHLAQLSVAIADSVRPVPVGLYQAPAALPLPEENRLVSWLKARLATDTLELYRRR